MKTLVENFSKQLTEAIAIGSNAKLSAAEHAICNVLVCGLGGSGIGGSIVSELVIGNANVPVNVSKGYFIPAYVNENTLVIISSYSGNTEETLNCMKLALAKNAKIAAVTSGGKVLETAKEKGFDCIVVPGGMPPRSCLGYSLTQLFFILGFHKIITNNYKAELEAAVKLLDSEEINIVAEATIIAEKLKDKTPVIYATTYNEGIAIRFRQQLNENAKILCWHQVIPEMNHNELVGWTQKNDNLSVLIFLDKNDYSRNLARVDINKEVIKKYTENIREVWSKGNSTIEKAIYFIHLGDWISIILGEMRGVDLMEVNVINALKSKLSEI
ncbi:MAG: Bifunctional phosphoglucose/phosphomannose isomerase [Bacteroidetes bacterium]|nr:Bifunctional phosphoglucose/phosphomannose isomerase [Bacteroidota bacterium]